MNEPGNETEAVGKNDSPGAEAGHHPDGRSMLVAQLTAARRELEVANRRILALVQEQERSRCTIRRLKTIATTDALTQLVNRRRFNQLLEAEFAVAVVRDEPISVIMVDVDYLKFYNDSFGHSAGDFVLCVVARHLARSARPGDVVARYGGDEFAVLLRQADAADAQRWTARYHDAISSFQWPKSPVTASFGVASRTPLITDPASLMEEADRALYHSKRTARSRGVYSGILETPETSSQPTEMTLPFPGLDEMQGRSRHSAGS